jgi:hypothetical protein
MNLTQHTPGQRQPPQCPHKKIAQTSTCATKATHAGVARPRPHTGWSGLSRACPSTPALFGTCTTYQTLRAPSSPPSSRCCCPTKGHKAHPHLKPWTRWAPLNRAASSSRLLPQYARPNRNRPDKYRRLKAGALCARTVVNSLAAADTRAGSPAGATRGHQRHTCQGACSTALQQDALMLVPGGVDCCCCGGDLPSHMI